MCGVCLGGGGYSKVKRCLLAEQRHGVVLFAGMSPMHQPALPILGAAVFVRTTMPQALALSSCSHTCSPPSRAKPCGTCFSCPPQIGRCFWRLSCLASLLHLPRSVALPGQFTIWVYSIFPKCSGLYWLPIQGSLCHCCCCCCCLDNATFYRAASTSQD